MLNKISKGITLSIAILCCWGVVASQTPSNEKVKELEKTLNQLEKLNPKDVEVKAYETNDKNNPKEKTVILRVFRKSDGNKILQPQVLLNVDLADYATMSLEPQLPKKEEQVMCGKIPSVRMSQIGMTPFWKVLNDYVYEGTPSNPPYFKMTVPAGFDYDRASVPRLLQNVLTKDQLGSSAPLLHDYLYRHGGRVPEANMVPYRAFSRLQSDELLRTALVECGASWLRAEAAYVAVRVGGCWGSWKGQNCD